MSLANLAYSLFEAAQALREKNVSLKAALFAGGVIGLLIGFLVVLDAQRRLRHLYIARGLIAEGIPEPEARYRSGASHWDQPFFARIWRKYPILPS
ncbi:hypothetical protein AO354_49410 [Pseudomonas syringae pv. syringae]|nr:hypothetical protein AO354_49410 [Pseudomonas syringae pv. syringae]